MKIKFLFSFLSVAVVFALILIWAKGGNAHKQSENNLLIILKISSGKQSYIQGEAVNLTFEAMNETDKAFNFYDVSSGYLKVQIAYDGKRFNQYKNSSWGRNESGGKRVKPGESFKSQAEVMWNSNPIGRFSNVESIVNSEEGAILSDYAFPEAGVYQVKAIMSISDDASETLTKIESVPIQIVVNKPLGDDLEVWNRIKDSREIANFMHRGSFIGVDSENNSKIFKEIETIVESYPNSLLVAQLKPNLEKFYKNEKLRKLYLEKRKKPQ